LGVELEDGHSRFIRVFDAGGEGKNHWYHVVLNRGRNKEVRRLWESQGVTVSRLIRVRFGSFVLPPRLKKGNCVRFTDDDMKVLKEMLDKPTQ
jgi:23S rRNA pseudouridine2605 synthase